MSLASDSEDNTCEPHETPKSPEQRRTEPAVKAECSTSSNPRQRVSKYNFLNFGKKSFIRLFSIIFTSI